MSSLEAALLYLHKFLTGISKQFPREATLHRLKHKRKHAIYKGSVIMLRKELY